MLKIVKDNDIRLIKKNQIILNNIINDMTALNALLTAVIENPVKFTAKEVNTVANELKMHQINNNKEFRE